MIALVVPCCAGKYTTHISAERPFMRKLRLRLRFYRRQLVGMLTLCALLAGTIGVPVPKFTAKGGTEAFPCQHRACGCSSAAACWKSCCCHTNREKVAWAKAHGVTPPAFVVAAAEKEAKSVTLKSCCAALKQKTKSCCDSTSPEAKSIGLGFVIAQDLRSCKGQTALLMMLTQVVVDLPRLEFELADLECETVVVLSDSADSVSLEVDSPPPRIL